MQQKTADLSLKLTSKIMTKGRNMLYGSCYNARHGGGEAGRDVQYINVMVILKQGEMSSILM